MHQLASERGYAGLEIATDMVANATNILSLATKNSGLVATLDTRFLSCNRVKFKQTSIALKALICKGDKMKFSSYLLCRCHKKCAQSHKQSQFTSKFILTSVFDIFKQSNLMDGAIL